MGKRGTRIRTLKSDKDNEKSEIESSIEKDLNDLKNMDIDKELKDFKQYNSADMIELKRKKNEKDKLPDELSQDELNRVIMDENFIDNESAEEEDENSLLYDSIDDKEAAIFIEDLNDSDADSLNKKEIDGTGPVSQVDNLSDINLEEILMSNTNKTEQDETMIPDSDIQDIDEQPSDLGMSLDDLMPNSQSMDADQERFDYLQDEAESAPVDEIAAGDESGISMNEEGIENDDLISLDDFITDDSSESSEADFSGEENSSDLEDSDVINLDDFSLDDILSPEPDGDAILVNQDSSDTGEKESDDLNMEDIKIHENMEDMSGAGEPNVPEGQEDAGSEYLDISNLLDDDANDISLDDFLNDANLTSSTGDPETDELMELLDMFHDDTEDSSDNSNSSNAGEVGDMSDIFSDVLGAVSSLDDEAGENIPVAPMPQNEKKSEQKKEKSVKSKSGDGEGFFKKLFANVEEDEETIQKRNEKEALDIANKEKKRLENKAKKEAAKLAKAEKKKEPKEKKVKPPKEKKPKVKKVVEPEPEDTGRINRAGAAIVITFFMVLAVFILSGTNVYSYTKTIDNAVKYFEGRKYTKAYDEVKGISIKEKDKELYEKIRTVMRVNKQLDSYNNYLSIDMRPEALNSLLKGIKNYDKYIDSAKSLGVREDLELIKAQFIDELKSTFGLSESQARKIINSTSHELYSRRVYQAAGQ